ncbi:MAG TPA: ABC transporter ATP-binding protein [Patescibacteria group bacterium]|nr:ABC transporter ATP-binding protein [Patescibacteria group bacterium]
MTAEAMTPTRPAAGERPALVLRALTKHFGSAVAVDGIDLDVRPGEFLTLLGPSGSGKTTTLRMVAGFMAPTSGSIEIDGSDMTRVPPHRRDVGMVFQNYALFPHMTAAENVAFPLRMRRRPGAEIKKRVGEALDLVKLGSFGDRYPRQLSGGQQQRIALARAVVFEPRLLLMDEPLGALDRKLRESLQLEIIRVSRELGATVLYVTHDQEEALVMSDRIAIFSMGRIEQLGSGADLYDRPASLFVADFIGESNILRGRYEVDGGAGGWMTRDETRWRVGAASAGRSDVASGAAAALVVRPERMRVLADGATPDGLNTADATVDEVLYLGPDIKYQLALPWGQRISIREPRELDARELARGERVRIGWKVEDGLLVADPASA